jgi:DNA-binding NarL/FixJ family response regulator
MVREALILQVNQDELVAIESGLAFSNKKCAIRVLHVDDDPSLLEVSKQILCFDNNFDIENVLCVEEAFQKLSSGQYDVIVSDYEMPQKNGLQFLQELKEKKCSVPFILFTGKGREEIAIKALNMGAAGYYNKQGEIETVYGELAHGIKVAYGLKKVEEQTKEQEMLRGILLDNIPCVAMIIEKGSRRIVASNKMAQAQGALPGKTCYGACASRFNPCTFCLAPELWETGKSQSLEVEYEGKYYQGIWVPYDKDHYVHYIFDITESKKAEKVIVEVNSQYAELFDKTPNGVAVYEAVNDAEDFVFRDFNTAAERIERSTEERLSASVSRKCFLVLSDLAFLRFFSEFGEAG